MTAPVPPDVAALQLQSAQIRRAASEQLQITTDAEEMQAAAMQVAVHKREKELEKRRMEIKRPILDAAKAVDALFSEPIKDLHAAKEIISRALGAYRVARTQRQQAMLQASRAPATPTEQRALVASGSVIAPTLPGLRETEAVEIFVDATDLVPREFCSPDLAKIKQAHKSSGGLIQIPGVRFVIVPKTTPTGR